MDINSTVVFNLNDTKSSNKELIAHVYKALKEKGHNPVNQLIGYILTEDPTYITSHNNARSLITRIDRYELLEEILKEYLNNID